MTSPEMDSSIPPVVADKSSVEKIPVTDLRSPEMVGILSIWDERRANRLMPARDDLLPRVIGRYLRHVSLLRVLASEQDYEMRIIGDVHVQAYGTRHQGGRISEIISEAAGFGKLLKASLDAVVRKRLPIAYRGAVGRDVGDSRIAWLETIFLPIGTTDKVVDHILNASVDMPKDSKWPTHSLG